MNLVRYEIGALQQWGGAPPAYGAGYTGSGVIVGIIATGVDWTHDDLKKADGTTRILYYWRQNTPTANPPNVVNPAFTYTYGHCWTEAEINAGLLGAAEHDKKGLGTHMASCAAGNGRAFGPQWPQYSFVGVAPEAEIVVVKRNNVDTACDPNDNERNAQAVDFIFKVAASLGKAAVVVTDYGGHDSYHNGLGYGEELMSNLGGAGKIIVAANGDDGDTRRHAMVSMSVFDSVAAMDFSFPAYTKDPGTQGANTDQVIVWLYADYPWPEYNAPFTSDTNSYNYLVRVVSPSGETSPWYGPSGNDVVFTLTNEIVTLSRASDFSDAGQIFRKYRVTVKRRDATKTMRGGPWRIEIKNQETFAIRVHGWIVTSHLGANTGYGCPGPKPVFGLAESVYAQAQMPATGDNIIAVGAYSLRTSYIDQNGVTQQQLGATLNEIAPFSSRGPRLGEDLGSLSFDAVNPMELRPYICAAGFPVAGALSTQIAPLPADIAQRTLQDLKHWMMSGSAVAAAIVAGGIATFLEQYPTYQASDIRSLINARKRRDAYTEPTPNHEWGVGKFFVADPTASPGGSGSPSPGVKHRPDFDLPP